MEFLPQVAARIVCAVEGNAEIKTPNRIHGFLPGANENRDKPARSAGPHHEGVKKTAVTSYGLALRFRIQRTATSRINRIGRRKLEPTNIHFTGVKTAARAAIHCGPLG